MLRNGILVLIVLGIFFGAVLFVGMYDQWQEAQIEKEKLDRESHERIEKEKIKAERERVEAERERVEAERERVEAETLEAEKIEAERLESLKTPEQKEAERLETEKLKMENLEAERLEVDRLNQERIDRNNQERKENLKLNTDNVKSTQTSPTCKDYQTTINEIGYMVYKFDIPCLTALHGTPADFDKFYNEMENLETVMTDAGITVQDINNQVWNTFASVELECREDSKLQEISTNFKEGFLTIEMCFNDVYEKYGWFPLMELTSRGGNSSEHNNNSCVLFCDSYGYEPYWAKSMGVYQAASKCTTILNNWESSDLDDQSWCTELAGYLVTG